ncbi:MAG: ELWxxDGT repeat protein, partial [Gemmataceae bacterium]
MPTAALLKDINTLNAGSDPSIPVELNGRLYFFADDGVHGREFWSTDGSASQLVKDINPGPGGSNSGSDLMAAGGRLFFTADDGIHGQELWTSDGTATGTHLVKDINPSSAPSPQYTTGTGPIYLSELDGGIAFLADDGVHGRELWVSDGTAAGTHMVEDINPGPAPLVPTTTDNMMMYFPSLATSGGKVYFAADDGTHGVEPWVSDGTAAGTHLVKDLNAGAPGSFPQGMMAIGGKVYFSGRVGTDWKQWVTDGTAGGTKESAIQPQPGGGTINGKSVFAAFSSSGSQLWAASGTAAPSIIHDFGNVTGAAGAFVPFN